MVFLGSMTNTVRICSEDISWCATSYHDCTHGERQTLRVTIRGILLVKHVVESGNLPVCVGNLGRRCIRKLAAAEELEQTHNREFNGSRS